MANDARSVKCINNCKCRVANGEQSSNLRRKEEGIVVGLPSPLKASQRRFIRFR
jgi:hypothetical protein